jgi:hypothetical protein
MSRQFLAERDRSDPQIAEALVWDPALSIDARARTLAAKDLSRWSHRGLLPLARALSLTSVWCIRFLKRVLPFQFRWHCAIDVLCVWFMRRFVSAEAGELLARHFVIETNLLAFLARNSAAERPVTNCATWRIDEPTLRPLSLAALGNHAIIEHDIAVYNLVIDVGQARADITTKRERLDFSMLEVAPINAEAGRKRWLELDIETSLYLMNIPFCLFTTEQEYERAVNSFQLDESVCAMLAGLTGDPTFRTWTPNRFPMWISVRRDVPKELLWHAAVTEYAHTYLCLLRDRAASVPNA